MNIGFSLQENIDRKRGVGGGEMWFLEGRVKKTIYARVEGGVCTYAAATKAGAGDLPRHGEDVKQISVDSVH